MIRLLILSTFLSPSSLVLAKGTTKICNKPTESVIHNIFDERYEGATTWKEKGEDSQVARIDINSLLEKEKYGKRSSFILSKNSKSEKLGAIVSVCSIAGKKNQVELRFEQKGKALLSRVIDEKTKTPSDNGHLLLKLKSGQSMHLVPEVPLKKTLLPSNMRTSWEDQLSQGKKEPNSKRLEEKIKRVKTGQ